MNVLFVTDERPWPVRSGYQIRMVQALEALASVGNVDLAVAVGTRRCDPPPPPPAVISRATEVSFRARPGGRLAVAATWPTSDLPRVLIRRDWSPAVAALEPWLRPSYDLAWFSHVPSYLAFGSVIDAPTVVDLDNLHVSRSPQNRPLLPPRAGRAAKPVSRIARLTDRVDLRRWQALDRQTARRVDAALVCSEIDREWLGDPRAVVVPNGYPAATPAITGRVPQTRVLVLVATLAYGPNLEAAHAFVEHVLPLVRRRVADAEVRLVGRFAREEDVSWLRQQPGVTVVGDVPSAADELAAARAVVVPIRSGGGTRIKILEAFAHRRPVVSTTIGAEGLEVVDGTHLLIADDVTGFADACVRLLHDDALCQQLAEAGSQLHADHYTGQRARDVIVDVAKRVAGGRRTTSGSAARR